VERAIRTLKRCLVCGSSEILTDEVVDRGIVLLAECSRCTHRWTEKPLARIVTTHAPEQSSAA
jgi:uncharacterized Zn finger protein